MRFISWALLIFAFATPLAAKDFATMFPQLFEIEAGLKADLERLDYKQGEIVVGDGVATFNVNDDSISSTLPTPK